MRGLGARAVVPLVTASLLLGACSASAESLENAVKDKPGVVEVEVTEHEDDGETSLVKIGKLVTVLMDTDASAAQVMAVFDAYDDDIDDGDVDVDYVEVVLEGSKHATLTTGKGVHATRPAVDDLVEIQRDDKVTEYRREEGPTLPSVHVTLDGADYLGVLAVADRYRDLDDVELVQVVSGEFLLIRDAVNANPAREAAGEGFVLDVNRRFRLTGAAVTGRGALRLVVAPAERKALQDYVKRHSPTRGLGQITVQATG